VKVSTGMDASWKIFSLNSVNAFNGRSAYSLCLPFSNPQNCFGRCLSMSGSVNCMFALPFLHWVINYFRASYVCACIVPLFFTAILYRARASLHLSLYHGARCFAHRLGFLDVRF
jgi:hypothetical protein